MTAVTISTNGSRPAATAPATAAERQTAARDAYMASVAAGAPLTGAALGRRFDMSERWGRNIVADARQAAGTNGNGQPSQAPRRAGRERNVEARDVPAASREPGAARREAPAEFRDPASAIRAVPATRNDGPALAGMTAPWLSLAAARQDVPPAEGAAVATTAAPGPSGAEGRRSWQDSLITLTVAVVAAAASYGHMFEVAVLAGEPLWIARAFPVTVDGLVLASLRRGPRGRWWLRLGVAVSVAANVLSRYPDLAHAAGPVVSAWPPLALYGTHRLLTGARARRDRS